MAQFASEAFTAAGGTTLQSLSGWTRHSASTGVDDILISDANRARPGVTGQVLVYYHSGTPATADYTVSADVVIKNTGGGGELVTVLARVDTAAATYYMADLFTTGNLNEAVVRVLKSVAGTVTLLHANTAAFAVADNDVIALKLEVIGTSIKAYKNGVEVLAGTDSAISAAGKAGIREYTVSGGNTNGWHADNFSADDVATSTILEEDGEWPWVTQNW